MLGQINSLDEFLLKQNNMNNATNQALSCLFRAILEPVLELDTDKIKSDVVYKVTNRDMFVGLLTRLEFSDVKFVDFGIDERGIENLAETDFLLVATSDFVSFLAWKQIDSNIQYSYLVNTPKIYTIIDILNKNSNLDLSYLKNEYKINSTSDLTNTCINKLVSMINNSGEINSDVIDNEDLSKKIENISKKARYISHEVKNQLSICDLYSGIIKKYCGNNEITDKTIIHSIRCIDKAIKIAGNSLLQLKSLNNKELKLYKTNLLLKVSVDLASAYLENRNIELIIENNVEEEILVDQFLFASVIINLIKNACEAFDETKQNDRWIKVSSQIKDDSVEIFVSNNAKPIFEPEKIFQEGMTTKTTGSGLGLFICKNTIEDQGGQISLIKSDEDSTIFQIKFCL